MSRISVLEADTTLDQGSNVVIGFPGVNTQVFKREQLSQEEQMVQEQITAEIWIEIAQILESGLPFETYPILRERFIDAATDLHKVDTTDDKYNVISESYIKKTSRDINQVLEFPLVGVAMDSFIKQLIASDNPLKSKLTSADIKYAAHSAMMHDIAKFLCPEIYALTIAARKYHDFTPDDQAVMDSHDLVGAAEISEIMMREGMGQEERSASIHNRVVARDHHKRLNKIKNLPFIVQVMGIIDVLFAIAEKRAYKDQEHLQTVLTILQSQVEGGLFAPEIFNAVLDFLPEMLKARNELRESFITRINQVLDGVGEQVQDDESMLKYFERYRDELLRSQYVRKFEDDEIELAQDLEDFKVEGEEEGSNIQQIYAAK